MADPDQGGHKGNPYLTGRMDSAIFNPMNHCWRSWHCARTGHRYAIYLTLLLLLAGCDLTTQHTSTPATATPSGFPGVSVATRVGSSEPPAVPQTSPTQASAQDASAAITVVPTP